MFKVVFTIAMLAIGQVNVNAVTCTFTGNGDGSSWTDGNNWSCCSEPDPNEDNVIIPYGFNVINDAVSDFTFQDETSITIDGSLDMKDKNLIIKDEAILFVSDSAQITNLFALQFADEGRGTIDTSANIEMEELKVDDEGDLTLHGMITVFDKLENLSEGIIHGVGFIDYQGSIGNFTNSGSGGIFDCFSNSLNDCSLNGGATLPIQLLSFTVKEEVQHIKVQWQSALEINNNYYIVERSQDLVNWEELSMVEGGGTSSFYQSYEYIDLYPLQGASYYRLSQVDFDGATIFLGVRKINMDLLEWKVYPNPAMDYLVIEGHLNMTDEIEIYASSGFRVSIKTPTTTVSDQQVRLDISDLTRGLYYIRLGQRVISIHKQ